MSAAAKGAPPAWPGGSNVQVPIGARAPAAASNRYAPTVASSSLVLYAKGRNGWKTRWRGPAFRAASTAGGVLGVTRPLSELKRYCIIVSAPRHGTNTCRFEGSVRIECGCGGVSTIWTGRPFTAPFRPIGLIDILLPGYDALNKNRPV